MSDVSKIGLGLALLGGLSAANAQEPPEPGQVRAQLERRLSADLESGLGPLLAERCRAIESGLGPDARALRPVRDGWLARGAPKSFLCFNPQWSGGPVGQVGCPAESVTETILDLDRQLKQHSIEFLVVPVPSRLNVYPDLLVELELDESFEGFAPGIRRWLLSLVDEGVGVVDILPALTATRGALDAPDRKQPFLRVNNHWAPVGVVAAADHLAARITSREWFERGPSETNIRPTVSRWSPSGQELPPGAKAPLLRFERVLGADGKPVAGRDKASPVVLLGDSFANMFQPNGADLGRQLHHRLGYAPDVIASAAGGPRQARAAFARRERPLEGKRMVIWIFTASAMQRGEKWEPIDLSGER